MDVRVNATQNGILCPRTRLELTCTSSCDWTLQGHRFRSIVTRVGCTHGSDVLINGTRRSGKCHTGTEGFQTHAEKTQSWSLLLSDVTSQSEFVCKSYGRRGERCAKWFFVPRTLLELTCTSSSDCCWQGHRFRSVVRSVGCTHGSDDLINGTRRSGKCHTGTEGFQTHAEMT